MKEFAKKNTVTIIIVIATLILAGIAIFTAIRLYQLRQTSVAPNAPESKPAAANVCGSLTTVTDPTFTPTNKKLNEGQSFVFPNFVPQAGKVAVGYELTMDDSGANVHALLTANTSKGATNQFPNAICGITTNENIAGEEWHDICGTKSVWSYKVADINSDSPTAIQSLTLKIALRANASQNGDTVNLYSLKWIYKEVCAPTSPAACQSLTFTIPTPTATATATASPTPAPQCGNSCSTNTDCPSSMVCYVGVCRNPDCTTTTSCSCATATPTVTATATATPVATSTATPAPTSTVIAQSSPTETPALPETGDISPTILGISAGAVLLILSLVLIF